MALKYYEEAEAEKLFQATFVEWASWKKGTYKGCYSASETKKALEETGSWARQSPTAQMLVDFITTSQKTIHIVGMRGGYQCFNSTEGPQKDMPVVFIDLDGKLTVAVRGPHNLHLEPEKCKGNVYVLDNRIALLHELGHAKQWIETPSLFDNVKSAKDAKMPQWGLPAQKSGGGQFDARLDKAAFAKAINKAAAERASTCPTCGEWVDVDPNTRMLLNPKRDKIKHPKALHICSGKRSDKAAIPTQQEVSPFNEQTNPAGYKPPVWGAKIEMDNMSRHEWRICAELGITLRVNYRDLDSESDGAPSLTSQIRRKAEIEARTTEQIKTSAPAVGTNKKPCPHCKAMFTERMLVGHVNACPKKPRA
jgi:hypothetical protein